MARFEMGFVASYPFHDGTLKWMGHTGSFWTRHPTYRKKNSRGTAVYPSHPAIRRKRMPASGVGSESCIVVGPVTAAGGDL